MVFGQNLATFASRFTFILLAHLPTLYFIHLLFI